MRSTRIISIEGITPSSAFQTLFQEGSCLFDTKPHETKGRKAFLGIGVEKEFRCACADFEDPYAELKQLEQAYRLPAIGVVAYDAIRAKEKIPDRHSNALEIPDFLFRFYKSYLVFDEDAGTLSISAPSEPMVEEIINRLQKGSLAMQVIGDGADNVDYQLDISDQEFEKIVEEAKRFIVAGEVFQIVLSRTFSISGISNPFLLYRALKLRSLSPYLFLIDCGSFFIVGASPEKLISVDQGKVESVPIAGTCSPQASVEELLSDPKESAEHMMLVDLARNDLGVVCLPGTVHVAEQKKAKRFSHIIHLVSRVVGQIDPKFHALDAFKAAFPAGTLSGAPKVRAMELIDRLEKTRRGVYGGSIVFLDGDGNLDSCIAIRFALLHQNVAYIRTGSGIVLDSDPKKEVQETYLKATGLLEALAISRRIAI